MLYYMNSNTALVIFAMMAMLGLATVTLVVPIVPQAQAQGNPGFGRCSNPGLEHHTPNQHQCS